MPDMKTIDLRSEGRTFDPWALWRDYLNRVEDRCAREGRGMTNEEIETANRLYFDAQKIEVIPHA